MAVMETLPLPTSDSENWTEQFDQALGLQHQRVRDFLTGQHQRIERLEAELTQRIQQLADELAKDDLRELKAENAEKGREIAELEQRLEEQAENLPPAVDDAATEEILDRDSVIQEERKKLKQLQDECREKLRQTEIDISLERATIGRQKAEIEQKLRALEEQGGRTNAESDDSTTPEKPASGRWLKRLGLKDPDKK